MQSGDAARSGLLPDLLADATGLMDEMPWHQRVRESAFLHGRQARKEGRSRNSSDWHREQFWPETVSTLEARSAFELGWDTENNIQRKAEESNVAVA